MIGLVQLAPVLLLPLFYRFKPLDRPALVERLLTLAARAQTRIRGVLRVGAERAHQEGQRGAGRHGAHAPHPARRTRCWPTIRTTRSRWCWRTSCRITCITICGAAWRCRRCCCSSGFFAAHLALGALGRSARAARRRRSGRAAAAAAGRRRCARSSFMPLANAVSRAHERRADRYALDMTRPARRVHLGDEAAVAAEPGRRASVAARAVAVLLASADSRAHRGAALARCGRSAKPEVAPL